MGYGAEALQHNLSWHGAQLYLTISRLVESEVGVGERSRVLQKLCDAPEEAKAQCKPICHVVGMRTAQAQNRS